MVPRLERALIQLSALRKELELAIADAKAEFVHIFGRPPRRGDRLLVDTYYTSGTDMRKASIEAMRSAKIRPELIYVYMKTGFMVVDPKLLSTTEEAEVNEAYDEFLDRIAQGEDVDEILWSEDTVEILSESLRQVQIIMGYFVDKYVNSRKRTTKDRAEIEFYTGFSWVNFTRCLRSIHMMVEREISFDAFSIARVLIENLFSVAYIYRYPSYAEVLTAQVGIFVGQNRYATNKKGFPIISRIIDSASGRQFEVPSRAAQAESMGGRFKDLYVKGYGPLSSFLHSDPSSFLHFLREGRFEYMEQDFKFEVLSLAHLLSIFICEEFIDNSVAPKYLKEDLLTAMAKSFFQLRILCAGMAEEMPDILSIFDKEAPSLAQKFRKLQMVYDATTFSERSVRANE